MPDDTMPISQTHKVASTPTTLPTKTTGADRGTLPEEVILLQEEMNRAMGHLLLTRPSVGAHPRKQVLDFKMAIHQNEAEVMETIREAKTHCGAAIREAEAQCVDHACSM